MIFNTIYNGAIRILFYPVFRESPILFKTYLKNASRILIYCPAGDEFFTHSQLIQQLASLFPGNESTLLYTGPKENNKEYPKLLQIHYQPPIKNIWDLMKSEELKSLTQREFDVLLDLTQDFKLLNIVLCRFMRPPLRIGFSKPNSNRFYNLQYKGKTEAPYREQLIGLYNFLKCMLSSEN